MKNIKLNKNSSCIYCQHIKEEDFYTFGTIRDFMLEIR